MSLPPRASIDPRDVIKWASIEWARVEGINCPTCAQPALIGFLGREAVAYACQRCGDLGTKKPD